MTEERVQRRLAAILAADMVGYSRLVGVDESGTIGRQKAHLKELIGPKIAAHRGRIVKTTGDGLLAEFASATDAVLCAGEIQQAMAAREAQVPEDRRIAYRIGINLGEVIVDGDDIFGDGVNIAARLEAIAEPGGILISGGVHAQVEGKLDLGFEDLGERRVKNIAKPVSIFRVRSGPAHERSVPQQEILFCRAPDGVQLAYASVGTGPPVVKAPNWLNHLEYDWESPLWHHLLHALAKQHRLVRFDARGNGLSDWEVPEISFDAFVGDLEAVVDAAGLDRFALFGISQGCAVSIAYAARHPERVTHLALLGGFSTGWRRMEASEDESERREAMVRLIRGGWGQDNPAFRQFFTSLFIPGGSAAQMQWFNDLQRVSTSPENAARIVEAVSETAVHRLLGTLRVPTLVMHAREDSMIPFEAGRYLAKRIPNARFLPLESRNHLILEDEPAWPKFRTALLEFLASDPVHRH